MKGSHSIRMIVLCSLLFLLVTPAVGQEQVECLELRKGDKFITISQGDWIVVRGSTPRLLLGEGKYTEVTAGELTVLGDYSNVIPLEEIGLIIHYGSTRKIGYYARRGLLIGFISGYALKAITGNSEIYVESIAGKIMFFMVQGMESSIPLSIMGGMAGLGVGAVANVSGTKRYAIGPDRWTIQRP